MHQWIPAQDWAIEKQRQAELQRRRAARGGGRSGGAGAELYPTVTNVELDTGETGDAMGAADAADAAKVLPPWMLRDGVESAGSGCSRPRLSAW